MNRLLDKLPAKHKKMLRKKRMPKWTAPMLATLTKDRFSDSDWIFERKLDGERCLVFRDGHGVRLLSRNRQRLNDQYPELVSALDSASRLNLAADGEIVAFEGKVTSFSRLQGRMRLSDPEQIRNSGIKVYLYLFDLLHLDAYDLTKLPLAQRKQLLKQAIGFEGALRFTPHRVGSGEEYYRQACRKGWEGIIAKLANSIYAHSRSRHWLKFKCVHEQEMVIGGYTEPHGSRKGFGALLLGYYAGKTLHYAGKVGTGFDQQTLSDISAKLESRERSKCPFSEKSSASGDGVHWVKPSLVAQIGFTEWTNDGRLRHPRFLGLRTDKPANKVIKERANGR